MHNFILSDINSFNKSIKSGEKLALFTVDNQGKPVSLVTGVQCVPAREEKTGNKYIEKAIEYIEDNYYKEIPLIDLADYCGISISHLCRLFSSSLNMTANEYILSYRMNRASYMLVNTDESVVTIAREVGCPDCGYFHKIFKKYFHVTPLVYRKKAILGA